MRVGDSGSLVACTTAVNHQILDQATLRAAFGPSFSKGYRVVLVDTPGFNNSKKSDSDVLHDIADWSHKWSVVFLGFASPTRADMAKHMHSGCHPVDVAEEWLSYMMSLRLSTSV